MSHQAPASRVGLLARRTATTLALALLIGSLLTSVDAGPAAAEKTSAARPTDAARAAPPRPGVAPADLVDLNTATARDLELLPGIGPAKAERILAFRAKHGPFRRVVDLRRVKGFGKKTVDRLAPLLTVNGRSATTRP